MRGSLNLRIEMENGDCEVFLQFEKDGFSGVGNAAFSSAQLEKFANDLARFPLEAPLPFLTGGYWVSNGNEKILVMECLSISVRSAEPCGRITLQVKAATPCEDLSNIAPQHTASAEIQADYEQLRSISEGIKSMLNGWNDVFIFEEQS